MLGLADLDRCRDPGCPARAGLPVEPTTELLAFLPLALVPTVAVPVAITLHIVSLRQLRAGARGKDQRTSMTIPYWRADTGARKAITAALACQPASDRGHRLR